MFAAVCGTISEQHSPLLHPYWISVLLMIVLIDQTHGIQQVTSRDCNSDVPRLQISLTQANLKLYPLHRLSIIMKKADTIIFSTEGWDRHPFCLSRLCLLPLHTLMFGFWLVPAKTKTLHRSQFGLVVNSISNTVMIRPNSKFSVHQYYWFGKHFWNSLSSNLLVTKPINYGSGHPPRWYSTSYKDV